MGLLKNNLYAALANIKLFLAFLAVMGGALLITGNGTLLTAFSLISAPAFALLAISCLRKEAASKWSKYKLTFPISRKEIIKSQFQSHMIGTAFGVLLAAVFMGLTVLIHGNLYFYYGFRDAITLLIGSGVLAFLMGAISYPMFYFWGAERMEAILAIGMLGSVGIALGLTWIINFMVGFGQVDDFQYYMSMAFIVAVTLAALALSFALSVMIFRKKEY